MKYPTPIIDRSLFFDNPEIAGSQLSPDGNYVSFVRKYEGILNIWVKEFDQSFEEAKLITASKTPITGYFWTDDSKYILYVDDQDGDENYNVYAVNPIEDPIDVVPSSRNLTPLKEITAQIYQVSKKNPNELMIGLNDRDKAWHDLYRLEIDSGNLTLIFENQSRITGWGFDWDENLRLAYRTDEVGNSEILRVGEDHSFETIYNTSVKESAYVAGWTEDNNKCYLVSNKGDVDLSTLYLMDPNTSQTEFIESDPEGRVDFGGLFFHDNTRELIYTSYTLHHRKRYWRNEEWKEIHEYLESRFPNREVGYSSMTNDYQKMLIAVTGDRYASEMYYFNRNSKELVFQYTPRPKLKEVEDHLTTMEAIEYASSDGMLIPAYLSLPNGIESKNLPLVVLIHGGPKGPRDHWGFDPYAQFLANRGYAVLQPNFRASGGFGKAFLNAGDKEWGKKMQDDVSWGVKYLIDKGLVDPQRVGIMGGSYGGYATLAGLAFTAELYACGVDIVGPSNLFTLLDSIPAYWESGRAWLYEMVGDPNTEEGKALLTSASPLFHSDQINAPLLIVQGANDPRVKKAEADQIAIALREKGHEVEYLLADDEGHGFRKPLNRMAMFARIEQFLAKHLNGRFQESMPDDVRQTLNQLSVDINSVVYEPQKEVELSDLPEMTLDVEESKYNYNVRLEVQEQSLSMTMIRQINKVEDYIQIKETIKGPMGEMTDVATFDLAFQPISRELNQAGQLMTFEYTGHTVSGNMAGNDLKIEAEGKVKIDGPGYDLFISRLGLNVGEQRSYLVVDMMSASTKQVISSKETEDKYVIQALENETDKIEMWIDQKRGMATKIVSVIPAMGNAVMTVELVDK